MAAVAYASYRRQGLEVSMIFFTILFLTVGNDGANISKDQYLEMKNYLKTINKPAVNTIKTKLGDIVDCVDMYKQHAFDHPLLQNHKIQMRPSSVGSKFAADENFTNLEAVLDVVNCPQGTIPVKRISMQHLLRAPSIDTFGKKYAENNVTFGVGASAPGHHYAVLQSSGQFYGTQLGVNTWEPEIFHDRQFSLAQLWIIDGPTENVGTIEVGWTVNVVVNHDRHTRLFIYHTPDGYRTGCYNLMCPGFIQVNPNIPIGARINPVSAYRGQQQAITLNVQQDRISLNWWLLINGVSVGYWPKTIFPNHFGDGANRVDWGGEVYSPPNINVQWPRMGSGHFPSEGDYGISCFMQAIKHVTQNGQLVDIPTNVFVYKDSPQCYNTDNGQRENKGSWARYFYFGGPGGAIC